MGKICFFFKEVVQGFGYQMFFNDCNYVNTKLQCYRFQKSALDFILIILVLPQTCSCLHASVNYTRPQGVPYVIFFLFIKGFFCSRSAHFCKALVWTGVTTGFFYPTVYAALHHLSVDFSEDWEQHLGPGLYCFNWDFLSLLNRRSRTVNSRTQPSYVDTWTCPGKFSWCHCVVQFRILFVVQHGSGLNWFRSAAPKQT